MNSEFVPAGLGSVFDDDYAYFTNAKTSSARIEGETGAIVGLLGIQPGAAILDVPCGCGQFANALAARGFSVTGVDANQHYVDEAQRSARSSGLMVNYLCRDMRDLIYEQEFDFIVNWGISFGFFDDEIDRRLLADWRRALRPGGQLLIEHYGRDQIARVLANDPDGAIRLFELNEDLMIDQTSLDPVAGRLLTRRTFVRQGNVRRAQFSVRVFTFPEIRDWLVGAGFIDVAAFDARGNPFRFDSWSMLIRAVNPA